MNAAKIARDRLARGEVILRYWERRPWSIFMLMFWRGYVEASRQTLRDLESQDSGSDLLPDAQSRKAGEQ